MDVEAIEVKRSRNIGKFHAPMPADLVPIKEKYQKLQELNKRGQLPFQRERLVTVRSSNADLIEESDFEMMLTRYITDENVDKRTLCEAFGISTCTFDTLVKSPKYAAVWKSAKEARADRLMKLSLEVASAPFNAIMSGENIHPLMVKSAQLLCNQLTAIAKVTNPELNQGSSTAVGGAGNVMIQVNTGINIPE